MTRNSQKSPVKSAVLSLQFIPGGIRGVSGIRWFYWFEQSSVRALLLWYTFIQNTLYPQRSVSTGICYTFYGLEDRIIKRHKAPQRWSSSTSTPSYSLGNWHGEKWRDWTTIKLPQVPWLFNISCCLITWFDDTKQFYNPWHKQGKVITSLLHHLAFGLKALHWSKYKFCFVVFRPSPTCLPPLVILFGSHS